MAKSECKGKKMKNLLRLLSLMALLDYKGFRLVPNCGTSIFRSLSLSLGLLPFLSILTNNQLQLFHYLMFSFLSYFITDRNDSNYRQYNQQQQGFSGGNNYQQHNRQSYQQSGNQGRFGNSYNSVPPQMQHQQQRGYQGSSRPDNSSSSYSSQQSNRGGGGYSQWRSDRGGGQQGGNNSNRGGYQRYDSQQHQRYHSSRPDKVQGPPSNHYGGAYSR